MKIELDEMADIDFCSPVSSGRCLLCAEPVSATGEIPDRCPFAGEAGCPLHIDSVHSEGDALAETIAFKRSVISADSIDGFPDIDDLSHRPFGQYRVGAVIGRGTMGRVYEAEHASLARPCALKIMNPGLVAREPQVVYRFWAEARAIAGLVHPHVVTVHNLGHERGYHYIEMEYVPGGVTLKERLVRDGSLDVLTASTLVRQVALALGAAHRSGLVHRDVKPANVLLAADGRAKLADFGLVRRVSERDGAAPHLAGTPTFMAPELFAGAPASPRSDLYALGVMYFYLLTARLPYSSDKISRLIKLHRQAPIPDMRRLVPEVPDEIIAVVNRLMAKDVVDRYPSADELADDLAKALGHLRETEALVSDSLAGLNCLVQRGDREGYRVIFPVPGDRIQEVYIEGVLGRKNERLLTIYSVCAPADSRHYEFALKLNAELTHGSLSIREVHGRPMFVMTRTFSRGHVSPAEIRAAVLEIARRGDRVEQQLTSTDVF
jgi:serine/threonine-protein kinase